MISDENEGSHATRVTWIPSLRDENKSELDGWDNLGLEFPPNPTDIIQLTLHK